MVRFVLVLDFNGPPTLNFFVAVPELHSHTRTHTHTTRTSTHLQTKYLNDVYILFAKLWLTSCWHAFKRSPRPRPPFARLSLGLAPLQPFSFWRFLQLNIKLYTLYKNMLQKLNKLQHGNMRRATWQLNYWRDCKSQCNWSRHISIC